MSLRDSYFHNCKFCFSKRFCTSQQTSPFHYALETILIFLYIHSQMVAAFTTLSGIPSDSTLPFHYSKTKLANSSSVSCDHLRSSQLNRSSNLLLPSGALVFICCFAGKSSSETQNLYCEIKQPFF